MMQLLAELPVHLALFACGALGWAITKWVTYRFCVPRRAPAVKSLFPEPEDDEVLPAEADVMSEGPMEDSQHAIAAGPSPLRRRRRQRRTGAATAEPPSAAATSAAPAPLSEPEAPRCELVQEEEECFEHESFELPPTEEDAAADADEAEAEAEAALAPAAQEAAAAESKAQEESAEEAVPAVSERVARLLAKKADRKARKAQEKLELERHDSQASQSTLSPSDSAVALLSETASSGGSALGEPAPLAYSTSSGDDLEASESIILAEQEETSGKSEAAADGSAEEDQAADEEGDDEGLWEEEDDEEEEEEDEEDCRAEQDCSRQAAAARLEWAEAAEEEDGEEWRCQPAAAAADEDDEEDEEDEGHWEGEAGACPDGWMLPLEEMQRGPSAAAPSELAVPSPQFFTPILSCDGQRLYTDGDVVYMMACVESPEGQSQEAGQMLRPVVDPADPLHGVMELLNVAAAAPNTWGAAQSMPNMSMPAPRRHDGDRRLWQEKRARPAASTEEDDDAAWGVCWDLFCKPW